MLPSSKYLCFFFFLPFLHQKEWVSAGFLFSCKAESIIEIERDKSVFSCEPGLQYISHNQFFR